MHEAIIHNLLILLEKGAFTNAPAIDMQERLEQMSPHKWRVLVKAANALNILHYVAKGAELMKLDVNLCPVVFDCLRDPQLNLEPQKYEPKYQQFANPVTNRRLSDIQEEEMNSANINEVTLIFLDYLISNANDIIDRDINIEGIIGTGHYLRENAKTIDFEKLNNWIGRLGISPMASFLGSVLVDSFHFREDEVPFIAKRNGDAEKVLAACVGGAFGKHSCANSVRMKLAMTETISHRIFKTITRIKEVEE